MGCDALENARQGLDLDGVVIWDHFVMFAIDLRRDADMRAASTRDLIAKRGERTLQIAPAHIAGQSHSARTSSLTKCNRTTLGRVDGSSK